MPLNEMPEQITELIGLIDNELDRFWTRFNIFSAVEIGAVIGLISNARFFAYNKVLLRFALVLMTVFSLVGAIVVSRGGDLQRAMVYALRDLEQPLQDSHKLLASVERRMQFRLYTNTRIATLFAWFCASMWPVGWMWLRSRQFAIDLPPEKCKTTPDTPPAASPGPTAPSILTRRQQVGLTAALAACCTFFLVRFEWSALLWMLFLFALISLGLFHLVSECLCVLERRSKTDRVNVKT